MFITPPKHQRAEQTHPRHEVHSSSSVEQQRGHVDVAIEQGRGLGVILAGSDQQGDHLVMALLKGHRQRSEAVLRVRRQRSHSGWRGAAMHHR
ncbi:hypothetical protein EYF80_019184 [Liparis tanakae]|uniref:Uncharacterized protein n=1 Tax=Liparis tanakae TaxID=230148 RepID=A0A4Z2HYI4_9TELE|nr:hypothetical protein EYF80_019184 [Liparis tanakae]